MIISEVKTEYVENPLGIDTLIPRLSWILESEENGQIQTAYQVLVASNQDLLYEDQADLWNSGKVLTDQSINVPYGGKTLASGQAYYWKVRAWDKKGIATPWSRSARWSMGLLDRSEWKAQWIGRQKPQHAELLPSPFLRTTFRIEKPVRQAFLYASALGLYELHVNGARLGSDYFTPGWTDYHIRTQYQTYDVTAHLGIGQMAIGAILGTGWYAGNVGMFGANRYGDNPYLLLQLHVDYTDGTRQVIVSDDSWKTFAGPIVYSDLLKGESFDARLEPTGWNLADFDDRSWEPVIVRDSYEGLLTAQIDPPVRVMKELLPVSMKKTLRGSYIFDMGQNMVGWCRLTIEDSLEGQEVTVGHAEMLNEDGTLYTINLREATQQETYRLKGKREEVLEPHFTFHGFRYVEVSGISNPTLQTVVGRVVHSATAQTGRLETSDVMLNKLLSNIEWGQRSNFLSVPTDCPQRDERLGWTGDAQIFARTASFNMDVGRFFNKYMVDVIDAQQPSGSFPDVAPDGGWIDFMLNSETLNWPTLDNSGWGDAGVIIPWTVYLVYADLRILEASYPAMVKYVDFLHANSIGLIRPGKSNYGDWLSIHADTPKDVLDTAYFAYSTALLSKSAQALGKAEDARKYADLFARIKEAFAKAFVAEDGRIKGNTQTDYVLALKMNLLTDDQRKLAIRHLVDDIRANGNHLTTGFLGVGYLLPALTGAGRVDVAYDLLKQHTFPSWLYSIKHGATTIWERWDAWTETHGFQNPGMNSFNHYSLGSVGEWMYQTIMGINAIEEQPGYKHVVLQPCPGGGLTSAQGEFRTVYGMVQVEWSLERTLFTLQVSLPVNTSATIYMPGVLIQEHNDFAEDIQHWTRENEHGQSVLDVGSGSYTFSCRVAEAHSDIQTGVANSQEVGA